MPVGVLGDALGALARALDGGSSLVSQALAPAPRMLFEALWRALHDDEEFGAKMRGDGGHRIVYEYVIEYHAWYSCTAEEQSGGPLSAH